MWYYKNMKGVILAGGSGTRLRPLTAITSKQLLPVFDKPLVYYPLMTLLRSGITEICVVVSPEHPGDFLKFLGSGVQFNAKFSYEIQDKPLGLAHGLNLAKSFADGDSLALILGDNIFEDDVSESIAKFSGTGSQIFVSHQTEDLHRFGVVEFDATGKVHSIEEKPQFPKSEYVQTGLYVYDATVFDKIATLQPSARGELEITDLHNLYLQEQKLQVEILKGRWIDAGTFESLHEASCFVREKVRQGNTRFL